MQNQNPAIDNTQPEAEVFAVGVQQPTAVAGVNGGHQVDVARIAMEVQAQVISAHKFPRDEMRSVDKIINSCTQPALADVALYKYSRGKDEDGKKNDIIGPSIRLAEEIARCWGNIQYGWRITAQGPNWSDLEAFAWDVESGLRPALTFRVKHWRDLGKGKGYFLNSERDIYELCANQAARRVRKCILQLIPAQVQEMAVQQVKKTTASDFEGLKHKIEVTVAYFKGMGISVAALESYLEHPLSETTPEELVDLRACATSIKEGERTAFELFGEGPGKPESETATTSSSIGAGLRESGVQPRKKA